MLEKIDALVLAKMKEVDQEDLGYQWDVEAKEVTNDIVAVFFGLDDA